MVHGKIHGEGSFLYPISLLGARNYEFKCRLNMLCGTRTLGRLKRKPFFFGSVLLLILGWF